MRLSHSHDLHVVCVRPHAQRFNFEAVLTEREWREFFLPPYQGSAEAGVAGFMCSYSSMTFSDNASRSHNTPACASEFVTPIGFLIFIVRLTACSTIVA